MTFYCLRPYNIHGLQTQTYICPVEWTLTACYSHNHTDFSVLSDVAKHICFNGN